MGVAGADAVMGFDWFVKSCEPLCCGKHPVVLSALVLLDDELFVSLRAHVGAVNVQFWFVVDLS